MKVLSITICIALHVSDYVPQNLRHGNFSPDTLLLMFIQSYFLHCWVFILLLHLFFLSSLSAFSFCFHSTRAELIPIDLAQSSSWASLCQFLLCCTGLGHSRMLLLAIEEHWRLWPPWWAQPSLLQVWGLPRLLWRQVSSRMAFTSDKKMPLEEIIVKTVTEMSMDVSEVWEQPRDGEQSPLTWYCCTSVRAKRASS